jgi:hypothetical protein
MMQDFVFIALPLFVFTYLGLNGLLVAISPLYWARCKWTGKGPYGYDHVANQLREGKGLFWRAAGLGMALLSIAACILITGWAF